MFRRINKNTREQIETSVSAHSGEPATCGTLREPSQLIQLWIGSIHGRACAITPPRGTKFFVIHGLPDGEWDLTAEMRVQTGEADEQPETREIRYRVKPTWLSGRLMHELENMDSARKADAFFRYEWRLVWTDGGFQAVRRAQ